MIVVKFGVLWAPRINNDQGITAPSAVQAEQS